MEMENLQQTSGNISVSSDGQHGSPLYSWQELVHENSTLKFERDQYKITTENLYKEVSTLREQVQILTDERQRLLDLVEMMERLLTKKVGVYKPF